MYEIAITVSVLLAAIVLFVLNRVPVEIVAIGVALALSITGVLSFEQSLAGFGDPVIVFIAALFVVSEALDATGVTAWAGQGLVKRAGSSRRRLLVLVMLLVAVMTALISVNGAVAALVPMVVVLAIRIKQPPSQMLMPLAFGAHAGSLLVLTGTPVNVLISELAVDAGEQPIGFFAFGLVGLPLVAGTILIVVLLGARLLPRREATLAPRDLSAHAQTLAAQYTLESDSTLDTDTGLTEVVVAPRSSFVGERVFAGMVTQSGTLVVVAIQRAGEDVTDTVLAPGDVMLLRGTWDALDASTSTVVLGQLISNMATALIVAPIAIAVAGETGISPLPLLMGVAVASAAAFLTPVATPANTMVLGPGAYRFGDYWKLGLPLVLLFVLVATLLVPVFWPFRP